MCTGSVGRPVPEDESQAELLALLEDEYVRDILEATDHQPMTAPDLAEALHASASSGAVIGW